MVFTLQNPMKMNWTKYYSNQLVQHKPIERDISKEEVMVQIKKLKISKAPGKDTIQN